MLLNRIINRVVFAPDGATSPPPAENTPPPPAAGGATPPAAPPSGGAAPPAGGGEAPKSWLDQITDPALRTSRSLADIKSVDELAKSYEHAQRLVGMDKAKILALPAEDDTAGWAKFWDTLGRPEKAEAYKLDDVKVPAGVTLKPELVTSFKEKAHALGLTAKQTSELYGFYAEITGQAITGHTTSIAARQAEAETALKSHFGAATQQTVQAAELALASLGNPEVAKLLEQPGPDGVRLGNNIGLVELLAKVAKNLTPDQMPGKEGAGGSGASIPTPDEAKQQINKIRADDVKILTDTKHPKHKELQAKLQQLYAYAYPEQQP